jgi:hypothetical protein
MQLPLGPDLVGHGVYGHAGDSEGNQGANEPGGVRILPWSLHDHDVGVQRQSDRQLSEQRGGIQGRDDETDSFR